MTRPLPEPRLDAVTIARALGQPDPTAEQRRVIEAPLAPNVVVAGAGSGKTETMAARVVWLVANGWAEPAEVLGLTFTRKAAGELSDRITHRLRALRASGLLTEAEDILLPPTVSTYHAYAAALVRDHGLRLGIEPDSRLLGEAATWQLVHDLVVEGLPGRGVDDERTTGGVEAEDLSALERAADTIVQAVISLAGQCAEHLIEPAQLRDFATRFEQEIAALPAARGKAPGPTKSSDLGKALASVRNRRILVDLLESFRSVKRSRGAMDFGDQIVVAAALAELPEVAAGEKSRFTVVLLDEFQDTSHAQLDMLARLYGGGHAVTAVGDPNQSIYGWRGASAGTLETFRTRFGAAGRLPAVLDLTTSWRNAGTVLSVANELSGPLRSVTRVAVKPLVAAPTAGPGRVEVRWHQTWRDESEHLADELETRWRVAPGQARPGIAVLCRQRSQFPAIADALSARGLPVEVVGLGGLLQRPEVADIVATLQVLHDPTRSDALARLLTGPRWLLGPRDLAVLGAWARQQSRDQRASDLPRDPETDLPASLIEAVDQPPPQDWAGPDGYALSPVATHRLGRLSGELRRLRALVGLPLIDLVLEVERALLLEIELRVAGGNANPRAQLDAFLDVTAEFTDGTAAPTLGAFLAWLTAAAQRERGLTPAGQENDEQEQPRDGAGQDVVANHEVIQVMTVHAAKGLEWDVVAVPGMVETRFPSVAQSQGEDSAAGWSNALTEMPYELRGDAASLPVWAWRGGADVKQVDDALRDFRADCGRHAALEERRLAYVAVTRARHELLLSGYRWDQETVRPRQASRFLLEVAALAESGHPGITGPELAVLTHEDADEQNACLQNPLTAVWPPPDPVPAVLVAAADAVWRADPADLSDGGDPGPGSASLPPADPDPLDVLTADVRRLLAERDEARRAVLDVALPVHLSASRAVQLARDPDELALQLRRPVPTEPQPSLQRGTAFHDWVERRLHSQALLDVSDIGGAADDEIVVDHELERFQLAFQTSVWAQREVLATEVDVETVVGAVVLRGRIDAVFEAPARDAPVRYDVVDWKTGGEPRSGEARRAAAVQLAVYRLAWARLQSVPVEQVRASFFYVATGRTVTVDDIGIEAIEAALARAAPADADWDGAP